MHSLLSFSFVSTALALAVPDHLAPRQGQSAVVNLGSSRGSPEHLASGFIYGIPDTENQVPDHWYRDMGFGYCRAGGAQLGAPNRGWIWGMEEYRGRLESTLSNYRTTRKQGGKFIILPHDVWGTDHSNDSTAWPGDNGDWSDYETFVRQLMQDMKDNNALEGLVWDIWNEPNYSAFWKRSAEQWVDLYIRTHKMIREDPDFDGVEISGPSLAGSPSLSDTWLTSWAQAVAQNDAAPDQYSIHLLGSTTDPNNDLQNAIPTLDRLRNNNGLPERLINVNEYASPEEQIPSACAWWISRLERYESVGLRANWRSGTQLHDLFANALTKEADPADYYATDYIAAPEYEVYKYYNQQMVGHRVETQGTEDRMFDVYATVGDGKVRILSGARFTSGEWAITVNGMSSVGLPESGTVSITTYGFRGTSVWDHASPPQEINVVDHGYSGDTLSFPIYQTDATTAWAFEFDAPNA